MGRIGRLFHKIQDIDYDLVYQPGSSNCTADLLSRPNFEANSIELRFESCVNWSKEKSLDRDLRIVKQFNEKSYSSNDENRAQECHQEIKVEWNKILDRLVIQNDVLCFSDENSTRIVIPDQVEIVLKVQLEL